MLTTFICREHYDLDDDEGGEGVVEFRLRADLSQASAPLEYSYDDDGDDWQATPFQTATSCHSAIDAARLVSDYANDQGGDGYANRVTVEGMG